VNAIKKVKSKEKRRLRSIKATTKNKRVHNRAMTLLLIDKGKSIAEIAKLEILSESGVKNVLRRYEDGGINLALFDRPRSGRPPTLSASDKQRIAAKACGPAPEGRARWTIALLTQDVATDNNIPTASRESVRQALHSHQMKPWLEKMWCVPKINDEYIERMEDILDLYERPYNSKRPVVCLDEKPTQLLDNGRPSVGAKLGSGIAKKDYEYKRNGTANVFRAVEPQVGRHFTKVTEQRKKPDFAEFLKNIADAYPKAKTIELVMDNLNTHNESSLIERYGKKIGSKIWSRFKIHYTPKHASWLNQAEIAIGIYTRQCIGKDRIPTIDELRSRSAAWNKRANKEKLVINWTFTKKKARKKFKYYAQEKSCATS
jgi:transposase